MRAFLGLLLIAPTLVVAQRPTRQHTPVQAPAQPVRPMVERAGVPAGFEAARAATLESPTAEKDLPPWWAKATFDESRQNLPLIREYRALSKGTTAFTAHLGDQQWKPLTDRELKALPGLGEPGSEAVIHTYFGQSRKVPMAFIEIEPYRRNQASGRVERLEQYRLSIVEEHGMPKAERAADYPPHSKLASGEWFRFTVPTTGVYELTYDFLQQLGVEVGNLASDQINIYGNHAGMLPFANSPGLPTDLLINAIRVEDGGDGRFDPGDRILFYATGAQRWELDQSGQRFNHVKNVYSDSASYFVGIGVDAPERIMPAQLSDGPANEQVTVFNDRQVINNDGVNVLKSGRVRFSEVFDQVTTHNYSFNLPNLHTPDTVWLQVNVLGRSMGQASSFTVQAGGTTNTINVPTVSTGETAPFGHYLSSLFGLTPSSSSLPISVTFNKYDPITSVGYMDYLEVNARRQLRMVGDQLEFRDLRSVGPGRVAEFRLEQAAAVQHIWEVTDPTGVREVEADLEGSTKRFTMATDSLRSFIAFKDNNLLKPVAIGPVPHQDLHATALPTDLIIVVPAEFLQEAERLAQRRAEEGLVVALVTTQQVYNEFSSGQRDATAIKRYMKMLFDRAGDDQELIPRYLLLFGDGSYDNIGQQRSNQNWVPTYQSLNSWSLTNSYTSDDYFVILADNRGEAVNDPIDMGVGRLPVSSVTQAREVVDKLLNYDRQGLQDAAATSCEAGGDGGAADWRTTAVFCSDDRDGNGFDGIVHMRNSDILARRLENESPQFNQDKIYMDAYTQYSTPGGQRYPDASRDLRDRVQKGALLVNYVGHGGEVGWAHERFLTNNTILGWTNFDRLPLFMTATCEFSRWDDPGRTSAGEYVLLNPNGGGIGLMTTTRLAFSSSNQYLAMKFFDWAFLEQDTLGRTMRMGDVYRYTKVAATPVSPQGSPNHRNFSLLGDPSMRLAIPRNEVRITAITDTSGIPIDTVKALSNVRIRGEVLGPDGQLLSDFDGTAITTVYDKAVRVHSLMNDLSPSPNGNEEFSFDLRKNVVYRGRSTVSGGKFEFTFVVPRDIDYRVGPGRVSVYAESAEANAIGYDNTVLIGGTDPHAATDDQGPTIELYMNDESFVNGGATDETPLIFAKLFDESGINTLGSSIGHDLTAVLDANSADAIVLNDWYEADKDTYKSGQVRYRLNNLEEGRHTLDLKAWDVYNNSSTKSIDFLVAPSAQLALEHVLNYPNPFTTHTEFFFEHNRPCTTLDCQVQVFTIAGRLVKTINRQLNCNGFRSEPLPWDGLDDHGDRIGRGVYVYRLSITTPTGESAEKLEKLVILR